MKLRRDLSVEFDQKMLSYMIINAMTSMIQDFLGTGDQDMIVRDIGSMNSAGWAESRQLEGTYVSFIYTGNTHLASVAVWCIAEGNDRRQWFNVLVDLRQHGFPVLAVYEDDATSDEDQVFIEFDRESLDFTIPSRS